MSKHKLVMVHGMGDFNQGWSEASQALIRTNYNAVRSNYVLDFDEQFEFVEINYNQFFEQRREQWKNQQQEMEATLTAGGISNSLLSKLMSINSQLTSDEFIATHVLDVILYRYIKQIAEQIRTYLAEQFILAATSSSKWSIIAHSLGTAVTHDTLHALFTHNIEGQALARHFRPTNLWMLANVSRVVSDDVDVYKSVVKPTFDPGNGVVSEYFDVRHPYDPIPNVRAFHSKNGEATHWRQTVGNRYQHILLPGSNVTQINVHDFDHYLKSPSVVRAINLSLAGAAAIDETKMKQYKVQYKTTTGEGKAQQAKIKFESISLGDPSTIEAFVKSVSEFKVWANGLVESTAADVGPNTNNPAGV